MPSLRGKFKELVIIHSAPFMGLPYLPRWIILLIDTGIVMFSFTIAYLLCYQLMNATVLTGPFVVKLVLSTVISLFFFLIFKTFSRIIRFSSFMDVLRVFLAVTCSNILLIGINGLGVAFFQAGIFSYTGFFLNFVLSFLLMFLFRMSIRLIYDYFRNAKMTEIKNIPLLIYSVTDSTVSLANMMKSNPTSPYRVVGFLTSDGRAVDKMIMGSPVYSNRMQYSKIIKKTGARTLLINPTELERNEKQELSDFCLENNIQMISPPPVSEWKEGAPQLDKMQKIQIEDLLGRVPIQINVEEIGTGLNNKCILVTGAAGSIGSEIVRQIGHFTPKLLLLCDIAESPLHYLQLEVEERFPNLNFIPVICDVRNADRMEQLFKLYHPDFIYHAAAYKHVPLMENHPAESVMTNVMGTKNVADLAIKYDAEVFVMISTDKAVNPTNVMGGSKRIAEIYVQSLFQHLQKHSNKKSRSLKIITTRFGNVLGSSGSVIPRFKDQIEKGGPVTVTHRDIIRFFMTIPEACRLVLEAGNMGKGGEIFVFDMGDPVKISDLAERMIRLAGYTPNKDIEIIYTGLRPGEKLYEEVLAQEETTQPTYNRKIKIANVRKYDYSLVCKKLAELISFTLAFDDDNVVRIMKQLVPEFISTNSMYEYLDPQDGLHVNGSMNGHTPAVKMQRVRKLLSLFL